MSSLWSLSGLKFRSKESIWAGISIILLIEGFYVPILSLEAVEVEIAAKDRTDQILPQDLRMRLQQPQQPTRPCG